MRSSGGESTGAGDEDAEGDHEHERQELMGLLVWATMGIAIWHFAVFVPDRFWGGIVGAFLAAILGAVVFGLLVYGFSSRDIDDTGIGTALIAIPGAALGLAVGYGFGVRAEGELR